MSEGPSKRSVAVTVGIAAARARGVRVGRPVKVPPAADRVEHLRAEGLSLQEIADTLTAEKVPTPSGDSSTWSKRSAQNVAAWLDRHRPTP